MDHLDGARMAPVLIITEGKLRKATTNLVEPNHDDDDDDDDD